jgi:hypothetical protein
MKEILHTPDSFIIAVNKLLKRETYHHQNLHFTEVLCTVNNFSKVKLIMNETHTDSFIVPSTNFSK